MSDYMSKPWILDCDANGNIVVREPGAKRAEGLPVFSTDTKHQAEFLQVTHCRLARDGSGIYTLNDPPRSVDQLADVAEMFAATRERLIVRGKWADLR